MAVWLGRALGAAALVLSAAAPAAQGTERRLVAEDGVDLFGGDLRSIFATDLESCAQACLADRACRAITFNTRAAACFIKGEIGAASPFPAAISARVVETPATPVPPALDFLPRARIDAARRLAATVGVLEGPAPGAAAARSDAAGDWLALARAYAGAATAQDVLRNVPGAADALDRALTAAVRAAMRAAPGAPRAEALEAMAGWLDALGDGRAALAAARVAQDEGPSPARLALRDGLAERFGFRVVGHSVDAESPSPQACFEFSDPLVAFGVDYADYLRLDGAPAAVEARDRQACVEGLEHGRGYRLLARPGLPAADGQSLVRAVEAEIYVRDRAPAARFAGRAHVLPRAGEAALPVITVNADRLALRIHRVGPRNLVAAVQQGLFGRALDGWSEDRIADRLGAEVWRGEAEVARSLNREVESLVPLGEAVAAFEPGAYVLTARPAGADEPWEDAATQWFVVTDLGLSTIAAGDGLHVTILSLGAAEPVAAARLTLLAANNEPLGTAETDAEGYARFAPGLMRGRGGMAPALLVAETGGGDFAFLDLAAAPFDLSDRGVEGRAAPGPVDVFATTERGVYRPGETVHLTALVRDARADAIPDLPLTAILTRPDGVEHARALLPDAGGGGRVRAFALPQGAQRGGWRLRLYADPAGPALAETPVLVEDFAPERLAVTLRLPEGPLAPATRVAAELTARWLFGAPGAGVATEAEARLTPAPTLPGWEGWRIGLHDDPGRPAVAVSAGPAADASGAALLDVALPPAPQTTRPLRLTLIGRALDPSGRAVERAEIRAVAPAAPLIALRPRFEGDLDAGAVAAFDVAGVGADLGEAALPRLAWTLNRLETRWQWYSVGAGWRWETVTTRSRVAGGEIAVAPGAPARVSAPVDWGRYELRVTRADGGPFAASSVAFTAGWRGEGGAPGAPDMLAVGLDRGSYAAGETARLRIASPVAGRALVTALGEGLLARRLVDVAAGETVVELPVTEDWGAGAYAVASLIRPLDAPAARAPVRAMGLAWAPVDPGPRRLTARIEAPETLRPRGPLDVAVKIDGLAPGERAWAVLAAVDVGVLNLTGFQPPAPDAWAFGQRRMGAALRDLYGALIAPGTGDAARLRSGGDGGARVAGAPPEGETVAFATAVLETDADGRARARFDVPDFAGALRLTAMVWTDRGLGHAWADALVREPVTSQLAGPRFLAPGDESRAVLTLTHAEGPAGAVTVRLRGEGGLAVDPAPVAATLAPNGQLALPLTLRATAAGAATLVAEILTPGGETVTKRLATPVRANDPVEERRIRVALPPGRAFTVEAAAFAGLDPAAARATLAAGPLAQLDVAGLMAALDRYPYGCSEQIASRALPLIDLPALSAALGLDAGGDVRLRVAEAVTGALANQTAEGGFGLWRPGSGDLWLDAYLTDFLTRARDAGHAVPAPALASALSNLRAQIGYGGDLGSGGAGLAYALQVTAREGGAALGDLRYHADARRGDFATPLALAQLGAALALYGEQGRADVLFREAEALLDRPENARVWRADYGSRLRDAAGVLALATEARSAAVDRRALAERVAAGLDAGPASTQEMAWALRAARALAAEGAPAGLTLDGAPLSGPAAAPVGLGATLTNGGSAPVAVALTVAGPPAGPQPALAQGFTVTREAFALDGAPAALDGARQGDRLVVVVTVTEQGAREGRLIVTDPLPAGFEIDNPALVRGGELAAFGWLEGVEEPAHVSFEDDRFVAALDWRSEGSARLAYVVRATAPGVYRHPAASVEDMYRPAQRGRSAGGTVRVLP